LFLYSSAHWVDWETFTVFLLHCTCPESDNGEDSEIVKSLNEVGLEPAVYKNPDSVTLKTVLEGLDNQRDLTGTLVLVKDVQEQENDPVERFMVQLTQLQSLKDKPKVGYCVQNLKDKPKVIGYCILSQNQYY